MKGQRQNTGMWLSKSRGSITSVSVLMKETTFTGSRDSNRSFDIISTLYCSFENILALFEHPEERRSKEQGNLFWNARRARDLTRVH